VTDVEKPCDCFSSGRCYGAGGSCAGIASKDEYVGGILLTAPDKVNHFIAKIDKTLEIEHDKIDVYQYTVYQYTYYTDAYSVVSESAYLVKV
jgi:hypothetical protein